MTVCSLDRVLDCPALPSLPSVAAEVLRLTRRPDVSAGEIASAVQHDPALTARLLRTVNSSYYGLTTPCGTLPRAVGYLGLNSVKSLVLGFTLVDALPTRSEDASFDLIAYWRRAVYGAASTRLIARRTRACDPEEAFLAALLQDVGMLACFRAMGEEYAEVVGRVGQHAGAADAERVAFGFDHTEVGAGLARRWRLPEQIAAVAEFHHAPERAPAEHAALVRCVALGTRCAAVVSEPDPGRALAELGAAAAEWFEMDQAAVCEVLREMVSEAATLSGLLEIGTGERPDVSALLSEAGQRLVEHQLHLERRNTELSRQASTDALTGLGNRKRFDEALERATSGGGAVAVLVIDADRFKLVNDTHGHQAGDAVLVEIGRRLTAALAGEAASACRYGGEEFGVVLTGASAARAAEVGERVRAAVGATPVDVSSVAGAGVGALAVTVSVGVCAAGAGVEGGALVATADRALYRAKESGRNRVVVLEHGRMDEGADRRRGERRAAVAGSGDAAGWDHSEERPFRVLLVESDEMHERLMRLPAEGLAGCEVLVARGEAEAAVVLERERFDLILCEPLLLRGGMERFVRTVRGRREHSLTPVVAVSASERPEDVAASLRGGANAFLTKRRLYRDPMAHVQQLLRFWSGTERRAA